MSVYQGRNYTSECIPGKELPIRVYTREGITHTSVYQRRNYPDDVYQGKNYPYECIPWKELQILVSVREGITCTLMSLLFIFNGIKSEMFTVFLDRI